MCEKRMKIFKNLRPWGVTPNPDRLLKKPEQNFYQNAISLHFSGRIYFKSYQKTGVENSTPVE